MPSWWQNRRVHSPDGDWWWDGRRWIPARSLDGTQWFDGTVWRLRRSGPSRARKILTTTGIVVASAVAFLGLIVFYAWSSGNAHDAFGFDDSRIYEEARTGCVEVARALSAPGVERRARLTSGNAAIEALVVRMEALGSDVLSDDKPAVDWLKDWERLAVARAAFGDTLVDAGATSFVIPDDNGVPITERMINVSLAECAAAITSALQP